METMVDIESFADSAKNISHQDTVMQMSGVLGHQILKMLRERNTCAVNVSLAYKISYSNSMGYNVYPVFDLCKFQYYMI